MLVKLSWLTVGSLISLLNSSLTLIKFNSSDEFFSIFSSKLDSLASSYKAKEYLLADVSENPLLLLNLLP